MIAAFLRLGGAVLRPPRTHGDGSDDAKTDGDKYAAAAVANAVLAVALDLAPAVVLLLAAAHRDTVAAACAGLDLSEPHNYRTAWVAARALFVASGVGGCLLVGADARHRRRRIQAHAAAYAAALLLAATAGMCVLGAQHYALAFPVVVALAPALAGACALGAAAGVLPASGEDGPEPRWLRLLRPAVAVVVAAAAACGDVPFRGPTIGPLVPGHGALPALVVDLAAQASAALALRLATLAVLLPAG